jgi:hypothetical protein
MQKRILYEIAHDFLPLFLNKSHQDINEKLARTHIHVVIDVTSMDHGEGYCSGEDNLLSQDRIEFFTWPFYKVRVNDEYQSGGCTSNTYSHGSGYCSNIGSAGYQYKIVHVNYNPIHHINTNCLFCLLYNMIPTCYLHIIDTCLISLILHYMGHIKHISWFPCIKSLSNYKHRNFTCFAGSCECDFS